MAHVGTSMPLYRAEFHFHKLNCLCMANFEGLDLVVLVQTYRKLNHGKYTPIHYKHPSMGLEYNPNEYTQLNRPKLEFFQQETE